MKIRSIKCYDTIFLAVFKVPISEKAGLDQHYMITLYDQAVKGILFPFETCPRWCFEELHHLLILGLIQIHIIQQKIHLSYLIMCLH